MHRLKPSAREPIRNFEKQVRFAAADSGGAMGGSMRGLLRYLLFVCALGAILVPAASFGEPLDLGGKTAVTIFGSVISTDDPFGDVSTILSGGIDGAWIMPSGRFEFGAGVVASGVLSDAVDIFFLAPSVSARVNTDPLGPDENVVLYAGGFMGFTSIFLDSDSETVFNIGPRVGVEFYVTPTVAVQLQEEFTI